MQALSFLVLVVLFVATVSQVNVVSDCSALANDKDACLNSKEGNVFPDDYCSYCVTVRRLYPELHDLDGRKRYEPVSHGLLGPGSSRRPCEEHDAAIERGVNTFEFVGIAIPVSRPNVGALYVSVSNCVHSEEE